MLATPSRSFDATNPAHHARAGLRGWFGARPVPDPSAGAKQVLDTERVAAWDYTWAPDGHALRYRAPVDTVIVWLGEGRVRVAGANGPATTLDVKSGSMRYLARGADETLEITSGSPRTLFFQLS
jgi:hypothetical protein